MCGSWLLWPARSGLDRWGLKQQGLDLGSVGLLAERHRNARALLLLAIPLLFSSPLAWQLGRDEALEGKILMLRNDVWAVLSDSAARVPVFHNGRGVTAACLVVLHPLTALPS